MKTKLRTYMTGDHKRGVETLKRLGIRTLADIDKKRGYDSRYGYVKTLVGDNAAMWIFNDLSLLDK